MKNGYFLYFQPSVISGQLLSSGNDNYQGRTSIFSFSAKKAMDDMKPGQILRGVTTDKGSINDMPAFAKRTGNELLEIKEEDNLCSF